MVTQVSIKQEVNDSFSQEAMRIMEKRYLLENETPFDMFQRVAIALDNVNDQYRSRTENDQRTHDYFNVMVDKKFTPAGRTLTNAGTATPIVPNCVVLPIHDDMGHKDAGIFPTLKDAALLQQAGCGLGFDFSELRPAEYDTKTSRGKASGPVSFLMVYDHAFSTIKQQGRHGANMAMMRIDHPDILDFINCKRIEGDISNFNISVTITDEFMRKVKEEPDSLWMCKFNGEEVTPRQITRKGTKIISVEDHRITVRELFDTLTEASWSNGEPGIAFIDTVNNTNPLPRLGDIAVSNPCAEQFLHPYDNCNLGSINLAAFAQDGQFDYSELTRVTGIAVEMLDNVIDLMDSPVEKINETAINNRRIGLGVMGWADVLSKLGVRYGSKESINMAHRIAKIINQSARIASIELAKERGNFPNISNSIFRDHQFMRNAAITTVAPTGTISKMFDCSSGIEPHFALAYTFTDKDNEKYEYRNQDLINSLKESWDQDEIDDIFFILQNGSKLDISKFDISSNIINSFVTTMDILPQEHIDMQAAWQDNIDNGISKTVNLPNQAIIEDVSNIMIEAWESELKSITVYRDGSRNKQVLTIGENEDENNLTETLLNANTIDEEDENNIMLNMLDIHHHHELKLPDSLLAHRWRVHTPHGRMYVNISIFNVNNKNVPVELFAQLGKPGQCRYADLEGQARLISLALRSGIPASEIADQLIGITCHTTFHDGKSIVSVVDGIGKVLKKYEEEGSADKWTQQLLNGFNLVLDVEITKEKELRNNMGYLDEPCVECGVQMVQIISGCKECKNCGHNTCD